MGAATNHPSPSSPSSKSSARTKIPAEKIIRETCPSFRRGHLPSTTDVKRLRTLALPHVGSFDYFLDRGLSAGVLDIVPLEIDLVDPKKPQQSTPLPQQQQLHSDGVDDSDDSDNSDNESKNEGSHVVQQDYKEVDTLKMWLENVKISKPVKTDRLSSSYLSSSRSSMMENNLLTPRECREMGLMYSGPITGDFCYQISHRTVDHNGVMTEVPGKICRMSKRFGDMPIMVMSKACHLHGSKPDQLVKMKEEVRKLWQKR